jgi:hypothetical protein
MSNWIDGLTVSIAAVILLAVYISLVWAWRRLAAMQAQLNNISSAVNGLELAHQGLLVRFINLPKSRRARKSSSPWSDRLEEPLTVPTQRDEENSKGSALYTAAPKTSPE